MAATVTPGAHTAAQAGRSLTGRLRGLGHKCRGGFEGWPRAPKCASIQDPEISGRGIGGVPRQRCKGVGSTWPPQPAVERDSLPVQVPAAAARGLVGRQLRLEVSAEGCPRLAAGGSTPDRPPARPRPQVPRWVVHRLRTYGARGDCRPTPDSGPVQPAVRPPRGEGEGKPPRGSG